MTDRQLAKGFFGLLDEIGMMPGTRHAAENSYCFWCDPPGYDHWKDQLEHDPRCRFVALMAEARKRYAKGAE